MNAYKHMLPHDLERFVTFFAGAGRDLGARLRALLAEPGAPVVEARTVCDAAGPRVVLVVNRWHPLGSRAAPLAYTLPVCVRYEAGGELGERCAVVERGHGVLPLPACPRWIMPDAGGRSWLAFALGPADAPRLRDAGFAHLTAPERVALGAAVLAAAGAGVTAAPWSPATAEPVRDVTVALAAGRAFSFGYAEHRELLVAAGADVVDFDPLVEGLPTGTSAVVIPGGFPEQFTAELSANAAVRSQIRALAGAGAPVHAECAGLTYLVDDLDGAPMCGVLTGSARFTERLTLGYRDAVAVSDSALHRVGERVTGHEFHRTTVTFAADYDQAWAFAGSAARRAVDGVVHRGVHAGYLHTHPAAHPLAITRFVAAAQTFKLSA
jgi:cobyrinic acid a,c-diamide synthase